MNIVSLIKSLPGACSQGLIWGLLGIGVYITFRVLDYSDMTVDGSMATGAAVAVMAMLVVFCMKDVNADNAVATLLASLCVIALQVYQRNTLLSITGGTALYMILLRMLG